MKICVKASNTCLIKLISLLTLTTTVLIARPETVSGQDSFAIPSSKVERKNKAPVSSETLQIHLPKPIEMKLANRLTILILEDHRLPSVFTQLHIRNTGALYEPANLSNLTSATAQMLHEST